MKKKREMTISEMAKLGGKARARSLSPARRKEIAEKAIKTRWAKSKKQKKGEAQ
jgi:hypothetical protein